MVYLCSNMYSFELFGYYSNFVKFELSKIKARSSNFFWVQYFSVQNFCGRLKYFHRKKKFAT